MAYANNRQLAEEYYNELIRQQELQNHREKQQKYGLGGKLNDLMSLYNNTKGTYNKVTGFGNNLNNYGTNISNFGSKLSQSQNPRLANMGTRMQNFGGKVQSLGTKFNGSAGLTNGAGATTGGASGLGTGTTGALGTTTGSSTGASSGLLGNAIAGQTAGTAGTAGAAAGTAGSNGALAGAIGAQTGGTAAATGASAGTIGAGTAAGTTAGTAGSGALAAGASTVGWVPVVGWAIAAAAAAKMIKDKIDQEHKKINAKAMQADAKNMEKAITSSNETKQEAQQGLQQQIDQDIQALGAPAEAQQQGYTGQLPDLSGYNSTDTANDIINQLKANGEQNSASPLDQLQNDVSNYGVGFNPNNPNANMSQLDMFRNNGGQPTGGAANIYNLPLGNGTSINSNTPINAPDLSAYTGSNQSLPEEEPEHLTGSVINGKTVFNNLPEESSSNVSATTPNSTTGAAIPQGYVSKNNLVESLKNGIDAFRAGFNENRNTGFNANNLGAKNYTTNKEQTVYAPSQELVDYQNQLKQQGLSDEIIKAVAEGRNSGNRDIANWIENNRSALQPQKQVVSTPVTQKKGAMNRLGEAVGTGGRLLSNPVTQGLLAGLAYGVSDNNVWTGLKGGIEYGQNKAKADYYYKKLTGKDTAPIFNNFNSTDYNAEVNQQYKDALLANALQKMQQQQTNADRTYELNKQKFEEQKNQNNIKNGIAQQRLGIQQQGLQTRLAKTNSSNEQRKIKDDYTKELNSNLAKYAQVLASGDEKTIAIKRRGMIEHYGDDFLKVEARLKGKK